MRVLNPKIVDFLSKSLKLEKTTITSDIYRMSKSYPSLTKNALAQLYAMKKGLTVYRKLDKEDKASLPSNEIVPEKIKLQTAKNHKRKIKILISYQTDDTFKKGHIDEINKAYTFGCYTSVFILARKIVENLIIDILKTRFPENTKVNQELYFDLKQKRHRDFGEVLKNLLDRKNSFGSHNKAVDKLYNLAIKFKNNTNDKVHSWYHLVSREKEIEDLEIDKIISLIKDIEKSLK